MNRAERARLDWDKGGGLLPAVVQDAATGAVLMLGYMDREALDATIASGLVTFFSRSRQALWVKGATSGNRLELVDVGADCDGDALLVRATPAGPVCHTGSAGCFAQAVADAHTRFDFLGALERVIERRIVERPEASYTARLHAGGRRRIAQKVGEEGLELALAAAGGSDGEVVAEGADLLFHVAVALRERGLSLGDVVAELERRHAARAPSGAG